ncbi:MAG TPA: type II secretion system F family protein, partial [Euryarchaeota archaeon]|nr:type II secretion system F family protein [Euryarchaeota archaeon]
MSFIEDYRKHLHLIGIRINPMLLFFTGFVVVAVSALLSLVFHELLFFLIGLVIADFIVFYPYYKAVKTVASIEENLADALKQIASTLQAGGTFEMALREVVNADYGPLSKQFRYVLNDLQGGSVIDIALGRFAERVPSDLVRRTVTIIIDAFHAGGGLAKVLEDV